MLKVIAVNADGERQEYATKAECANAHGVSVKLLTEMINTGRAKKGWTFDFELTEECNATNKLARYNADRVAKNLKYHFHRRKITVNEIAMALDVSAGSVSRWLDSADQLKVENMLQMARLLDLSVAELFM